MKKFFYTLAFLLTFSFAFANNLENGLHKINQKSKSKNYSHSNNFNDVITLTLSYDVTTFCAYSKGISKPTVSENGGVYKSTRTSSGGGGLAINQSTGQIDRDISNPGTYEIEYKIGNNSAKTTITVTDCK